MPLYGGNVPSSGPGDDEVHEVVIHKNRVSLDLSSPKHAALGSHSSSCWLSYPLGKYESFGS